MGAAVGGAMKALRKASGLWVVMLNVKDLSRDLSIEEADTSTRGTYPWKSREPTFYDWSTDWNQNYDDEDADFLAILECVKTKAPIELAFTRGNIATPGTVYFHVPEAKLFSHNIDEALANAVDVAITAKNSSTTNPPGWKIVGEESESSSSS